MLSLSFLPELFPEGTVSCVGLSPGTALWRMWVNAAAAGRAGTQHAAWTCDRTSPVTRLAGWWGTTGWWEAAACSICTVLVPTGLFYPVHAVEIQEEAPEHTQGLSPLPAPRSSSQLLPLPFPGTVDFIGSTIVRDDLSSRVHFAHRHGCLGCF